MLVYFWLFTLSIITVLYLFVCVDGHQTGCLAKMKRFLFSSLPNILRGAGRRMCGAWLVDSIDAVADYLCYQANPIVQVIYLVCAVGGYATYVRYGFCHMPGPYISDYHKYTGSVLMFACYYSYYKACTVQPGYITTSTKHQALKRFKFDDLMFQPK